MRYGENHIGKRASTIILITLFVIIAVSCIEKSKEEYADKMPSEPKIRQKPNNANNLKDNRGNSTGNIANSGFVAQNNGWIYYCNPNVTSLYKMKSDGTNESEIFEGNFYEINVVGDWVYCSDEASYRYYKIKNDGTEKYKLSEDECYDVNITENWIYYISSDHRIYKMDLDGGNKSKLNDDKSCRLNAQDGWIYFCKINDETSSKSNEADWLPYGKIYKMRTDGSEEKLVCDDNSSFVNVDNGWIYYSNVDDDLRLYKIKIDGTGKTKLNNDSCCDVNVADQYVYYSNISSLGELYRIGVDGTERTLVGDFAGKCWDVNVTDKYLFFNYVTNTPGVDGFYRIRLNGTEKIRVQ